MIKSHTHTHTHTQRCLSVFHPFLNLFSAVAALSWIPCVTNQPYEYHSTLKYKIKGKWRNYLQNKQIHHQFLAFIGNKVDSLPHLVHFSLYAR
jgi:hypothetical protein